MVTNQEEQLSSKRQNDDSKGTPRESDLVQSSEEGDMKMEIESKMKKIKRNETGDLDELGQEVGLDLEKEKEENIDDGEEIEEEQEKTEEEDIGEYIGM